MAYTKLLSKDAVTQKLEDFIYNIHSISSTTTVGENKFKEVLSAFRIIVVTEGKARIITPSANYFVEQGDCVILAPGSMYTSRTSGDSTSSAVSIRFSLKTPVMAENFQLLIGLRDILIFKNSMPESIFKLAQRAYDEAVAEKSGSYFFTKLTLESVLGLLLYSENNVDIQAISSKSKSKSGENVVLRCHNYIINNPSVNVTVEDLCALCDVSQSYLYKSFKSVMNKSTKEFITETKLRMTEDSLLQTDKSITEIAREHGYPNTYQYSNIFKKNHGISPSEFRKRNR